MDILRKGFEVVENRKRKAYLRAYRLAHKKEIAAKRKVYNLAHKKERKAYRLAHKKEIAEREKTYRLAHKKEINEKHRAYLFSHKKENTGWQKKYHQKHPEKQRIFNRKRRALKRGGQHKPYATNYVFERDNWVCQICGRKINRKLKYPNPRSGSIDHIVPLSKGGNDSPINVQATHLRCNVGKHAINKGQLRLFN